MIKSTNKFEYDWLLTSVTVIGLFKNPFTILVNRTSIMEDRSKFPFLVISLQNFIFNWATADVTTHNYSFTEITRQYLGLSDAGAL